MAIRALYGAVLILSIALSASGALVDTCQNYISRPQFICNGESDEVQAMEMQDTTTSMVLASSGDNPMTYDEFITYPSQVGIYSMNTPRNLQFSDNCLYKSPNQPLDCTNTDEADKMPCVNNIAVPDLNNTTWGEMALNVCAMYYPSLSTNVSFGPPPAGQVLVGPISKCQNMTWTSDQVWIMTDEWKNTYIMHASGANTTDGVDDAAKSAALPPGWSVAKVDNPSNFSNAPNMDEEGNCYYDIIRDSADNSYHQIGCLGSTYPTDFNPACPAGLKSPGAAASPSPAPTPNPATSPPAPGAASAATGRVGVWSVAALAGAAALIGAFGM